MRTERTGRIVPLGELDDYKVAEGDPDVRGWDVVASDERKIGRVGNLLVDTDAMRVRYLAVERDAGWFDTSDQRDVLVPIGIARLDRDGKRVIVGRLASTELRTLPGYRRDAGVTRDYETLLRPYYDRSYTGAAASTGFYEADYYDDRGFYGRESDRDEERITLAEEELAVGKRERQAGAVEVEKRVETEHVRKTVPVMREEVTVERRPITDARSVDARFEGEEIRIPLTEEEVVVDKRAVAKEELVINKHQVQEEKTVEAALRKERAEVHAEGDVHKGRNQ
jgi:uncharacterized protein (TIGR02271 family)